MALLAWQVASRGAREHDAQFINIIARRWEIGRLDNNKQHQADSKGWPLDSARRSTAARGSHTDLRQRCCTYPAAHEAALARCDYA